MADRPHVQIALRAKALNGECPAWSPAEQKLYWADIRAPALHRFDPETGRDERWSMPAWLGCYALAADHAVLALRTGLHRFEPATGKTAFLAAAPFDPRRFAFNDGGCDRQGRFLAGPMHDPLDGGGRVEGAQALPLWRYEPDGGAAEGSPWAALTPPVRESNGLAFSPDGRTMYHADTASKTIWAWDYEPETGEPSRRRVFAQVDEGGDKGGPDGATVDADGFYICAVPGAGRLLRFDPQGRLERRIPMPAQWVTMPAFGGPDLRTLYVTSLSWVLSDQERAARPEEGALFALEAPAPGPPPTLFQPARTQSA